MITIEIGSLLAKLGVRSEAYHGGTLQARTPITGEVIAAIPQTGLVESHSVIERAHQAFLQWRTVPAPRRGELVRLLGDELRQAKEALGLLVTLESGKILTEGLGEVQEMIDICTYAAGLSRQLHGLTIASERPNHRMLETWHPLGVTGVISAFNFPVAVWAWNAALALVCGNPVVWKPSEKTPLCALAVQAIFERACSKFGDSPSQTYANLCSILIGGREIGQSLVDHRLVPLISATGSSAMGREVGPGVAARFARSILELGGNNAAIVCPSADLDLTLRAITFSAMGTAGQRCTTLRRLFLHDSLYDALLLRLKRIYDSVTVADPREQNTLVGPLIDRTAFTGMQNAFADAQSMGGRIWGGVRVPVSTDESFYVRPALIEMPDQSAIVKRETFAPILYVMRYSTLDDAIRMQNDVPQGLASSIFTNDLREAEQFLSATGSDCGIANVNIGPSGAEIGGAFGGEKETGGGRESGSDVWKQYMRRATNTINYGRELPLAQGVHFDINESA